MAPEVSTPGSGVLLALTTSEDGSAVRPQSYSPGVTTNLFEFDQSIVKVTAIEVKRSHIWVQLRLGKVSA